MCSFLVYTKENIKKEDFEKSLEKIKYRGPDMSKIIIEDGMWGFNRLTIMGLDSSGMQPFLNGKSKVVCNGEIYGFRKIKEDLEKKDYKFISDSDCEILLPLLKEMGTDMFRFLDSEFACVLYDGTEILLVFVLCFMVIQKLVMILCLHQKLKL